MKKLINNVVMLDMTSATLESVEGLTINNAVTVFVTPLTKSLIGKINFGNLVQLIELPDGATITKTNGSMTINGNLPFDNQNIFRMINGNIIIKNDVQAETIINLFKCGAAINGVVIAPDTLSVAILSSAISFNGELQTYPADSVLFENGIKINNGFLKSLAGNSKVAVVGDIEISSDTQPDLFETNISELVVFGKVFMYEGISEAFFKVAREYGDITVCPDGYKFYEGDIIISTSNILSFKNKNIYTKDNIIFKDNVTESQVNEINFQIKTEGIVFCPEKMGQIISDRVITDRFHTYKGVFVIINDSYNLTASELETEGGISFLVNGGLDIAGELEPELLTSKVSDIFLYGEITCYNENQKRALYKKIIINEGNLSIAVEAPREEETVSTDSEYDIIISNAVEYAL